MKLKQFSVFWRIPRPTVSSLLIRKLRLYLKVILQFLAKICCNFLSFLFLFWVSLIYCWGMSIKGKSQSAPSTTQQFLSPAPPNCVPGKVHTPESIYPLGWDSLRHPFWKSFSNPMLINEHFGIFLLDSIKVLVVMAAKKKIMKIFKTHLPCCPVEGLK